MQQISILLSGKWFTSMQKLKENFESSQIPYFILKVREHDIKIDWHIYYVSKENLNKQNQSLDEPTALHYSNLFLTLISRSLFSYAFRFCSCSNGLGGSWCAGASSQSDSKRDLESNELFSASPSMQTWRTGGRSQRIAKNGGASLNRKVI